MRVTQIRVPRIVASPNATLGSETISSPGPDVPTPPTLRRQMMPHAAELGDPRAGSPIERGKECLSLHVVDVLDQQFLARWKGTSTTQQLLDRELQRR
jgi:hypothetical protein